MHFLQNKTSSMIQTIFNKKVGYPENLQIQIENNKRNGTQKAET